MNDAPQTPAQSVAAGPDPAPPAPPLADGLKVESLVGVSARRGALVRLAYRFCWNLHDAEDMVQNALVQAAQHGAQLADPARAWSWVRAIVVRQCHDLRRRARRVVRADEVLADRARGTAAPASPHEVAARGELSERVRQAIDRLPERQRTALVLHHLEEMPYAEIAELMGISESTARVQVRNARENLRRVLQKLTEPRP